MWTEDEIIELIQRRPVPPGQINLYKVLYSADIALSVQELADIMREGDVKSMHGVLLALAKRIRGKDMNERDDALSEILFIVSDSDDSRYRLSPALKSALERCLGLKTVFETKTIQQIYEEYGRFPPDESKYLDVNCN